MGNTRGQGGEESAAGNGGHALRGRRGRREACGGGGAAGGAVSARRRAECSGRRPGHVRTRGRGPRRPPPWARRDCGYGAGGGAGARGGGGWAGGGGAANSQLGSRELGATTEQPGPEPDRLGRKVPKGADRRGGLSRVSVGLKFWSARSSAGTVWGGGSEALQGGVRRGRSARAERPRAAGGWARF